MNIAWHFSAVSSTTADIAFYVCVISVFIAGGAAVLLLLDKIKEGKQAHMKPKLVRPTKTAAKKPSVKKKPASRRTPAKKPAKKR